MMIGRAVSVFLISVFFIQTEGCEEYDLVVIMDASGSVGKGNFDVMKDFVKEVLLLADVDNGQVQVGVVIYSTRVFIQFHLNTYKTRAEVFNAIDKISYPGGNTNTADALKVMRTEMFTTANGDRPNVTNIAIVMTDGESNINYQRTIPEAEQARAEGIHIYVIGIGVQRTTELDAIASRPVDQFRVKCKDIRELGILLNKTFVTFCKPIKPRLSNGTLTAGRLEILVNGEWGTVCDSGFGSNEAQVACRMLGLNSIQNKAVDAISLKYGQGLGDIIPFSLVCHGTETSLEQCSQTPFSFNLCDHSGNVGIMCNITSQITARLVDGTPEAGRLEIFVNEEWYTVCEEGFGKREMEVACRMLGFNSTEHAAAKSQHFGLGSRVQFNNVKCRGFETSLDQCEFGQLRNNNCMDVGIICDLSKFSLRLTGTGRTRSDMGRVEVEILRGRFSRVCVSDEMAAKIVCRQLNLPSSNPVLTDGSLFGRKKSPLLDVSFHCEGNESSLFECTRIETTQACLIRDVAVYCNDNHSLYIVSEGEAYPLMEGAAKALKCVTPQGYERLAKYTWPESARGLPDDHLLIFNNLTKEFNGRQVKCSALLQRIGSNDTRIENSNTLVLEVYFLPLITITWTDIHMKPQQTFSDIVEVIHGHNVTLWCKGVSNPPPASITWSGRVNSTTGELQIIAAEHVTHSGLYTCTVVTQTVDDDDRLPLMSSYQLTLSVQALELRLTGTSRIREDMGRVEIKFRDVWGALCGEVNRNSATVICRQLGHPFVTAMTTTLVSSFGPRKEKDFVVTDLYCSGRETNISACVQNFTGLSDWCKTKELGVICSRETSHLFIVAVTSTDYPIKEGANISLKCENPKSFQPATNYTWPKSAGGRPVGEYLIFDKVTKDHNKGQVMCAAFYNDTSQLVQSDTSILQVYYAPSLTIFSNSSTCIPQAPSTQVCAVTRGHNATFLCIADSNPATTDINIFDRDWICDHELTITDADPAKHDGYYFCMTAYNAGDDRPPHLQLYPFTIVIQYPPSVMSFQLSFENQTRTVAENSDVSMLCTANGRPAPRMLLIRGSDNSKLTERPQGDIQLNELRRNLSFVFCKAHCEDSGDYICKVDNGVGHDSETVRLLVLCAPRRKTSEGQLQYLDRHGSNRNFSINMIAYPTPQAVRVTYQSSVFKVIVEQPLTNDKIRVTCDAKLLSPAEVICHIGVTQVNEGFYQVLFSNNLGNLTVDFMVTSDAEEEASSTTKPSDTAVIAGAAVAGAAVVGLSASSSLLFWKKRKRQRLLAEQEKHRNEGGSFRPLHEPEEEETYVDIEDVADEPAVGEEYGYSEIDDGTGRGRRHKPPLPQRDAQRTGIEDPYDQAISSSEDVRPGTSRGSKKTTKKVSLNLHGTEIPYGVCKDTEQQQSSSETSSEDSPASSSPSSKGNESESYTYPGSQHGKKEDYLTPAPSSPGAEQTGSRSLATAAVRNADDYLTPTSADSKGRTQVVTAEVTRADDYLTPTSDTGGGAMTVAADGVRRADDYLTPTSNTSTEGRQAVTTPDYYLTPISGDTVEGSLANDYFTPATEKSGEGSTTPGVADDKQAHIYTPLLPQPQFVLSEEMKKAGYLTPVHIPTTPDTQETDSTISDRKKAGYLTPVEVPGSPELGSKSQERSAPSQDIKKPQDYLTPVSSSSSSSVAAPAKKKKEKSSMIPLAEFWSSKRLSSQRKSPPSSEGETEATHTYEKMGNVKYTEPGNDPAYTKIGEVPVTVSTDPDSYQNC